MNPSSDVVFSTVRQTKRGGDDSLTCDVNDFMNCNRKVECECEETYQEDGSMVHDLESLENKYCSCCGEYSDDPE